ncbi:probable WRKY transcription factor 12 isoform X2 [Magnolia sinica]|uniref:probable WRKY transcription factor 12 isoform X2 n=1 Tax=Magnolia sinica TaxID=86752 RepID=UPI00265B718F|nr:probable WRKY transcription factor 12 isoform X2 [Magnolia sinica]
MAAMEGARAGEGGPRCYDLDSSFSGTQAIHDMEFVQMEENHGLSFMVSSQTSSHFPPPQASMPFNTPMAFNDHPISKPWNHDQMESLDPRAGNEPNCTGTNNNDGCNSWWRSSTSEKSKVKMRRKLREPRFCFQTRSDVDVLDDGYKWRKYGQKIVKNSLHPSFHQKLLPVYPQ